MLNYSVSILEELVLHKIGKKSEEEGITFSGSPISLDDPGIFDLLKTYFLKPFKEEMLYQFTHESELGLNEIFSYSTNFFEGKESLYDISKKAAMHLYENSNHPQIKEGEFYTAHFKEIKLEDEVFDVLGFFKSETKDTYLKILSKNKDFDLGYEDGININKLDKGCLIFNTSKEEGYRVMVVNNENKSKEIKFWKDHFLDITPRNDPYHKTNAYIDLYKDFVKNHYNEEEETPKSKEIDLLNRGINYFKSKEKFDEKEFESEIIEEPELVKSFQNYKKDYSSEKELIFEEEFDINPVAVKKAKSKVKNIIQLDNNFKIQVFGNRDYIVKGHDNETGLNYYVLYFEEEK